MCRFKIIASLIILAIIAGAGCFSHNNLSLWPKDDGILYTKVVSPAEEETKNRILLLDIDGIITEWGDSSFFRQSEPTTFKVRQKLEKALGDPSIKALIVRINSPGGGTNASDVVYQEIIDYKTQARIPVVAMQMGVAASGGYYVSCAADRIIAHPNTITGSIGVISYGFGFDGLFEKIGMESRVTKSGELKDMGNPFDKWEDNEKKAMQGIIDEMYDRFADVVIKTRNVKKETVNNLQGKVITASEAKKLGLVDQLGYIDDGIAMALKLAGIRDADVIMYVRSNKANRNVYTLSQSDVGHLPGEGLSVTNISAEGLLDLARPRVMYLWLGN